MKIELIRTIIFLFTFNIFATQIVVVSDITANTNWDSDTVIVNKELLEIHDGARLTIAPGTHVVFAKSGSALIVRGMISAKGTIDDSIFFARANPSDQWLGIRLIKRIRDASIPDTSFFQYCDLRNSSYMSSDSLYLRKGGVLYNGAGNFVSIQHCSITGNTGDIGGAVYCDSGSVARINDCLFLRNRTERMGTISGGGAIMTSDKGTVFLTIANCRFEYNKSRNGGALRTGGGTFAEINNCIFFRDSTYTINPLDGELNGGAIALYGSKSVVLRNCLVFYCRSFNSGGAIYSSDATLTLINCTIAQNFSKYGAGCYLAYQSVPASPLFVNTIIMANGTTGTLPRDSAGCGVYLDNNVTPVFRNCHMNDTVYDYTIKPYAGAFTNSAYCMTYFEWLVNTKNTDTSAQSYQLYKNDTGIDSGTPDTSGLGLPEYDLAGNKRINGTAIDIGAFEYYNTASIRNSTYIKNNAALHSGASGIIVCSVKGQILMKFDAGVSPEYVMDEIKRKLPHGKHILLFISSGKTVCPAVTFVH